MAKAPDCKGDHDCEWVDDSFDHEFGTETCGYWECVNCEYIDENSDPPQLEHEDYGEYS